MPKIIDHEKRRDEILRRAFALFSRQGYQNTSLSNLADVCHISRPTLYLYFKDKEELFRYALKHFTDSMLKDYKGIAEISGSTYADKIEKICIDIIAKSYRNSDFVQSLADFIIQMRHQGEDVTDAILRRTVKLKYLFSQLMTEAIKQGELEPVPVREAVNQLLSLIQAMMFQIILVGPENEKEAIRTVSFFLGNIRAKGPGQ